MITEPTQTFIDLDARAVTLLSEQLPESQDELATNIDDALCACIQGSDKEGNITLIDTSGIPLLRDLVEEGEQFMKSVKG